MGPADGEDGALDDGAVSLAVEALAGNLGEQVVEPPGGPGMRVRACHGHVVVAVDSIGRAKGLEAIDDAVPDGSIPGLRIQHQVDEPLLRLIRISDNKGPRIQPLAQTSAQLLGVCVAHQVDLDHGACNISLANPEKVAVPGQGVGRVLGMQPGSGPPQ